jgi:hypothetical protein
MIMEAMVQNELKHHRRGYGKGGGGERRNKIGT